MRSALFIALALVLAVASAADPALPPYSQQWFTQTLDHYNFATRPLNFQQRYLVVGAFRASGPTFVLPNLKIFKTFYAALSLPYFIL
jgi:hypothetical protein